MLCFCIFAISLVLPHAAPCNSAGNECCSQAILSCPHLDAGEKCRAEHWKGISDGPGCGNDYIYTHCVNGNMYSCLVTGQCNCQAGPSPQNTSTDIETHINTASNIAPTRVPSPACSTAGNDCCSNAILNCPNQDSYAKCSAERMQGGDDSNECAKKINYDHCVNGARLYCEREKQCNCESAPMPTVPIQTYDANLGGLRQALQTNNGIDRFFFLIPAGGVVIAFGAAIAMVRMSMSQSHTRLGMDDSDGEKLEAFWDKTDEAELVL